MELKTLEEAINFIEEKGLNKAFINKKFVTIALIEAVKDFQSDKFQVFLLEGFDRKTQTYYVRGIMIEKK